MGESFVTATIAGWQRHWAHRVDDERAAQLTWRPGEQDETIPKGFTVLTVAPASTVEIDGVLAVIGLTDLPALDRRESGYARHTLNLPDIASPVALYVSSKTQGACREYPLLQSYVDCVLAGYLAVFGWQGVTRFIATTKGWEAPIIDDRSNPLYPRAVTIEDDIRCEFDERILAARRCAVVKHR